MITMNDPLVRIEVPLRAVSWNHYYTGLPWRKRSQWTRDIKSLVRASFDPNEARIQDRPVIITVTAYGPDHHTQLPDPDNVCAKPIIDGLVGWFLEDDSSAYVAEVRLRVRPRTTQNHWVVVELYDAAEGENYGHPPAEA